MIRVEPVELISEKAVGLDVELDKRQCRMDSEMPEDMTMFKKYSRNACLFNCMHDYR